MSEALLLAGAGIVVASLQLWTGFVMRKNGKVLAEIHVLTNSNLTKVTNDLADANRKIDDMTNLLSADTPGKHLAGPS